MINCQWTDEELSHHLNAEAKKYIADNNIQLYTINAIDKAIEIGMGKRTNTILQSAFFKLAEVMPIDDAIKFMKQAAQKSYGKKGQDVVEMNWKAIDAGVDAIHKVDVPASWSKPRRRSRSQGAGRPSRAGQADPRRHGAHRPHGRRQPARLGLCPQCKRPVGAGCFRL